jgi:hypothetical protein
MYSLELKETEKNRSNEKVYAKFVFLVPEKLTDLKGIVNSK